MTDDDVTVAAAARRASMMGDGLVLSSELQAVLIAATAMIARRDSFIDAPFDLEGSHCLPNIATRSELLLRL